MSTAGSTFLAAWGGDLANGQVAPCFAIYRGSPVFRIHADCFLPAQKVISVRLRGWQALLFCPGKSMWRKEITSCLPYGTCGCTPDQKPCGNLCCPPEAPKCIEGIACCKNDQIFINGACCDPANKCGHVCCEELSQCADPLKDFCCPILNDVCDGQCCDTGAQCINGKCCPHDNLCGGVCCPTGQTCVDSTKHECVPCPAKTVPCLPEVGKGLCCAPNVECCTDTCCKPGEWCLFKTAEAKFYCGPPDVPK